MNLTQEQVIRIQENSRGSDRPTYYDVVEGIDKPISETFEAFSILVDPDLREEIIERLGSSSEGDPTRRELYLEALSIEESETKIELIEAEARVSGFGAFRQKILDSPLGSSTDVAPLIQDIQRSVSVVSEYRDRVYHSMQVSRVLKGLDDRLEGNEEQARRRDSWIDSLSEYRRRF